MRLHDHTTPLSPDQWQRVLQWRELVYKVYYRYFSGVRGITKVLVKDALFDGLLKAVVTFSEDKDAKFITWAYRLIFQEGSHYMRLVRTKREEVTNVLRREHRDRGGRSNNLLEGNIADPRESEVEVNAYWREVDVLKKAEQYLSERDADLLRRLCDGQPTLQIAKDYKRTAQAVSYRIGRLRRKVATIIVDNKLLD